MIPAGTIEHGGDTVNDEQVPIMYCDKHQNPTHFCCERCDTPICPLCMVFGPLGQQCSDDNCDRRIQAKLRSTGGRYGRIPNSNDISGIILRDQARQRSYGGSPAPESSQATPATMLEDTSYGGSPDPAPPQEETSSRGCGGFAAIVIFAAIGISVFFFYDELREGARQFTDSEPEYSQASAPTPNTQATVTAGIEATVQAVTSSGATPIPASATMSSPTDARPGVPTPIPSAAVVRPSERHIELKRYMLALINVERAKAGADPVVLGDNIAAQLHAESTLANCFSSLWGVDGLKPYMRYSLAGGYQSNRENRRGLDYCITASDRYRAISIEQKIQDTLEGWMESPPDQRRFLDHLVKKVNIGLAWDRYNFSVSTNFEGDYVEYVQLPTIENGIFTMSGTVKNGAGFADERDLGVQIYYDQPPQPLTRGQLVRTYCSGNGPQIALLRRPLPPNRFYSEHEFTKTYKQCPDPHEVPADAPAPTSPDEAHAFWEAAYRASQLAPEVPIMGPRITALEWTTSANAFSVAADISDLLARHGNGVYSITVWGVIDGERDVISKYSIFYGVTPPDTYDPSRYE